MTKEPKSEDKAHSEIAGPTSWVLPRAVAIAGSFASVYSYVLVEYKATGKGLSCNIKASMK